MKTNFQKGLTILETIIALSALALLVAIILPSFATMRNNQVLKSSVREVTSALERAQFLSISSVDSSEYGVHFEANQIVIFKGTVYSAISPDNEIISISYPASLTSIILSGGGSDVYFDRLSGGPNKTGTVTIVSGSVSRTITITATGAINTT